MLNLLSSDLIFVLWWVLINSLIDYAEIDFLLSFTGNFERKTIPFYVGINAFVTILTIQTKLFGFFGFFHILLLFLYASVVLKIKPKYIVAPAVIIFTLSTIMEGFVAVFMRYSSLTFRSPVWGLVLQFVLTAVFCGIFFQVLRFISRRYQITSQTTASSYCYLLLLPFVWTVWQVRTSLGLDHKASQGALINGNMSSVLYASLWMTGILMVFFVIIEMFHKISILSRQEMEKTLLASQVKEQLCYIDEARKRNEGYRSFQHDINNHLLVISGLLHEAKYKKAESYLQKLNLTASSLSEDTSTGNSVLDVLLWEKTRYAKQCGISVTCSVQIPEKSIIDDIDLCILISNGMDNAITACLKIESGEKTIALNALPKHGFLLIDMVNSTSHSKPIVYGTGLKNIKLTAEKYHGTMRTEQKENHFCLSILLSFGPQAKENLK